jgi:hypothetical protein
LRIMQPPRNARREHGVGGCDSCGALGVGDAGMRTTVAKPKRTRQPRKTTARSIELYSSAHQIAWKHISALQKREQPDISLRIHASIRRQLKKGAEDPNLIASEALSDLQTYSGAGRRKAH